MQDPRPCIDLALDTIVATVIEDVPALEGLTAHSIVVVALSAYGTAAASVRSLDGMAAKIVVGGHTKTIELGLRPPFFRDGDLAGRLVTLVHELLHLDPARPGTLRENYRHHQRSQREVDAEAQQLATRLLETVDPLLLAPLGHHGEVLMRTWARRPVPETKLRVFDDKDVFRAPVSMLTPSERRSGWW